MEHERQDDRNWGRIVREFRPKETNANYPTVEMVEAAVLP